MIQRVLVRFAETHNEIGVGSMENTLLKKTVKTRYERDVIREKSVNRVNGLWSRQLFWWNGAKP